MLVRFFRLRPIDSGEVCTFARAAGLFMEASVSSSHRCSIGFSLHMFLKLRLRASNLEIVVWLKSLLYSLPIAKPTSPWVKPATDKRITQLLKYAMEDHDFQYALQIKNLKKATL